MSSIQVATVGSHITRGTRWTIFTWVITPTPDTVLLMATQALSILDTATPFHPGITPVIIMATTHRGMARILTITVIPEMTDMTGETGTLEMMATTGLTGAAATMVNRTAMMMCLTGTGWNNPGLAVLHPCGATCRQHPAGNQATVA